MAFVDPKFPGVAYGMGTITENGEAGQLVKLSGHDEFALNDDPAVRSFGILYKPATAGELCTVFTNGGIYETDNFVEPITPGERLKVDAAGKCLAGGVAAGDVAVGEAISVGGGILRFKLQV